MLLQHYILYVQLSMCNANMMLEKNEYETFQNIDNMNIIENSQGEVFCSLLLNSKDSGVSEDSKSPTLGV